MLRDQSRSPSRRLGLALAMAAAVLPLAVRAEAPQASPRGVVDFFQHRLDPQQGLQPTRVRLISDNNEAWFARWWALEQATESIDITYFNFYLDAFGKSVLGVLRKKAQEGVKVRLMVDNRGSFKAARKLLGQRYLQELAEQPNVEVRVYKAFFKTLQTIPRKFREFVAGNHDKIMVVDGRLAVMGGRNLGEKYFAAPADDPEGYIDHDILLEGEGACGQLRGAFEEEFGHLSNFEVKEPWMGDWFDKAAELDVHRRAMERWITGRGTFDPGQTGFKKMLRKLNETLEKHTHLTSYESFRQDAWQGRREVPAKVLDKHSYGSAKNEITPNLVSLFDSAQESILIQNAYLVLTESSKAALKRASDRGVDIRFHTNSPASTSNLFVQAFFVRDWKEWMRDIPNLRIFMAEGPRKIHSKLFVIDGEVSLIGSYNIDPMSEGVNSEVVTLLQSSDFAERARLMIRETMDQAAECKIRVEPDGSVTGLVGPDDYLEGFAGKVIRLIGKMNFLRPLV